MKKSIIAVAALSSMLTLNTQAVEITANVFDTQLMGDTYRDKNTGDSAERDYNDSTYGYSIWFDVDDSKLDEPLENGTQLKYGFGAFKDNFNDTGYHASIVVEPRLSKHSLMGMGNFETYYGIGVSMATTHQQYDGIPVPIMHIGIRTNHVFANLGTQGLSPALTGKIGVRF